MYHFESMHKNAKKRVILRILVESRNNNMVHYFRLKSASFSVGCKEKLPLAYNSAAHFHAYLSF